MSSRCAATTVFAVPGAEGRAGMAALVVEDELDLEGFHRHVLQQLPVYARPVFLRIQREIETTTTFKQRKVDLVKEGFDPATIADPIYFLSSEERAYLRLDKALYAEIQNGKVRL
jgi:fatty-acyl-CoA synthase